MVTIPWECTRRRASLKNKQNHNTQESLAICLETKKWLYKKNTSVRTALMVYQKPDIPAFIIYVLHMYSCYIAPENMRQFLTSEIAQEGQHIWNYHIKFLRRKWMAVSGEKKSTCSFIYTSDLKWKMQFLPSVLANNSSKIAMSFRIMDSFCHFLFMKYGQETRNCRRGVNWDKKTQDGISSILQFQKISATTNICVS